MEENMSRSILLVWLVLVLGPGLLSAQGPVQPNARDRDASRQRTALVPWSHTQQAPAR